MELATNLFTQGLLMDTHPMVLGNNTLTDCLNGTLVTMNGNEVVLQNDMGNRKIDKAFLPSGYEPVGIKEYGGIIYVAAYNPITNKSLIGSFPSPQLTYSDKNGYSTGTINNNKNIIFKDTFKEYFGDVTIEFLKYFLKLFPFKNSYGEEIILHSGDKFTIYASDAVYKDDHNNNVNLLKEYFTNYNNVNNGKLKSPKNKKYTLSIGVLNSQNEFVDFTNSLLRWEEVTTLNEQNNNITLSTIISFDDNIPDYIKFNSGYFIPLNYSSSKDSLSFTIADSELNEKRLKLAANTYAYKLTGPLYAKIDLNIINNLTYNIYGNKNDTNNKITLNIETIYEYNCPDFIGSYQQSGDDKYESYEEVDIASTHITHILKSDIYIKNGSKIINPKDNNNDAYTPYNDNDNIISCKYNPDTNTYKLKKLSTITINTVNNSTNPATTVINNNDILDLVIVPKSSDNLGIRKFTYYDTIEISKLNSNEITLSDFRYYNNLDENLTLLTVGFKSYPEYGSSFENLKIEISKLSVVVNNNNILNNWSIIKTFDWGDSGYNGTKTFNWDWSNNDKNIPVENIKSHTYKVTISYDINKTGEQTPQPVSNFIGYLITTKLFNNKYNYNSSYFVRDFNTITNLPIELSIIENNDLSHEIIDYKIDGDKTPFKSTNSSIKTRLTTTKTQRVEKSNTFGLDRDLYPKEITISSLILGTPTLTITKSNNGTYSWGSQNNLLLFSSNREGLSLSDYTINSNTINLTFSRQLIGHEIFEATDLVLKNITINNLFTSFHDKLDENVSGFHSILHPYATINVLSENSEDTRYGIGFTYQNYSLSIINFKVVSDNVFPYHNNNNRNSGSFLTCGYMGHAEPITLSFSDKSSQIFDIINNNFRKDKFFFVGTNNNFLLLKDSNGSKDSNKVFSIYDDDSNDDNSRHYHQTFPRPILFWMRTINDGWALLPIKRFTTDLESDIPSKDGFTGGKNLTNGWLGKYAMTSQARDRTVTAKNNETGGKNRGGNDVLIKFLGLACNTNNNNYLLDITDSDISGYLKSRFKEFYYIGEKNAVKQLYGVSGSSTITKNSLDNVFNVKVSILPPSITGSMNSSLLNIFSHNNSKNPIISTSNTFTLFEKNIEFNKNSNKFEDLSEDFLSANDSIDYGLSNKITVNGNTTENIELFDSSGAKFNPSYLYIKNNGNGNISILNNFSIYYDEKGCLRIPQTLKENAPNQIHLMFATHDNDYNGDNNDQVYLLFDKVGYIPDVLLND